LDEELVDYSLPVLIHVTRNIEHIKQSHVKRKENEGLKMSLERHVTNKLAWAEWQLEKWISNKGRYLSFDISCLKNITHINHKKVKKPKVTKTLTTSGSSSNNNNNNNNRNSRRSKLISAEAKLKSTLRTARESEKYNGGTVVRSGLSRKAFLLRKKQQQH
jgi:hypothetical protein